MDESTGPWYEDPASANYHGGDPTRFGVRLSTVSVGDSEAIELPSPGVTVVVGGNNVGKSTLLGQLAAELGDTSTNPSGGPDVLHDHAIEWSGDVPDFVAWLGDHAHWSGPPNMGFRRAGSRRGGVLNIRTAVSLREERSNPGRLGHLSDFLVAHSRAQERAALLSPVALRGNISEPPTHQQHAMEDHPNIFEEFQQYFDAAFDQSLTIDTTGSQCILRVGEVNVEVPLANAITAEYRQALASLPLLVEQGDGITSMMGLLLLLVSATHPIVLIDEPEAFLHPPQAWMLGRAIGELAKRKNLQVLVATHDRNFVAGLLDDREVDVKAVRLSRAGDRTTATQLDPQSLRDIWNDPALRYTNVLDGLFHQAVVLTESDADCTFYAAALEAAHLSQTLDIAPHNVLFVPSSGKQGMASLVRVLRAIGVAVVASPDLDVLNDDAVLRGLIEALGTTWSSIETDFDRATAEFQQPPVQRKNTNVLAAVRAMLEVSPDAVYTKDTRKAIAAELSVPNRWDEVKQHGMSAFRADRPAADRLIASLDEIGVVAVVVGELERFAPSLDVGKGPRWLPSALEAGAHEDEDVRRHVRRLVAAASRQIAGSP